MKLMGATNVFVRAPFIIEGIILGAVGSIIPLVLLYYMYDKILTYVAGRFQVVTTLFAFVSQQDLFKTMIPVGLVLGIGVGLFGSIITTRKNLKV
jgi:cell division transport system permease protein